MLPPAKDFGSFLELPDKPKYKGQYGNVQSHGQNSDEVIDFFGKNDVPNEDTSQISQSNENILDIFGSQKNQSSEEGEPNYTQSVDPFENQSIQKEPKEKTVHTNPFSSNDHNQFEKNDNSESKSENHSDTAQKKNPFASEPSQDYETKRNTNPFGDRSQDYREEKENDNSEPIDSKLEQVKPNPFGEQISDTSEPAYTKSHDPFSTPNRIQNETSWFGEESKSEPEYTQSYDPFAQSKQSEKKSNPFGDDDSWSDISQKSSNLSQVNPDPFGIQGNSNQPRSVGNVLDEDPFVKGTDYELSPPPRSVSVNPFGQNTRVEQETPQPVQKNPFSSGREIISDNDDSESDSPSSFGSGDFASPRTEMQGL